MTRPLAAWILAIGVVVAGAPPASAYLQLSVTMRGQPTVIKWNQMPVRWFSYAVDTALLTAALMLLTILPGAMFANGWLTLKLVLVVAYVVLGSFALKRGRTPRMRTTCFVAALLVFVTIIGIALAHHPLGWLLRWFG